MAKAPAADIDSPTLDYFAYRGPHQVAIGSLDGTGLSGLVVAPVAGRDFPVVALGHGWLQPVGRYADTMRWMASWGIVAVAPATQRGVAPSAAALAVDLRTALDIVVGGRLGGGRVRVDGNRMGVFGHSIGGSAAVLAAAAEPDIKAVVTVTAARSRPSAVPAATGVRVPGLHFIGSEDSIAGFGRLSDGAAIAAAWAGDCQLRTIKKAGHLALPEGSHWSTAILGSEGVRKAQLVTRTLATAFFRWHLAGDDQLESELGKKYTGTTLEDLDELREDVV